MWNGRWLWLVGLVFLAASLLIVGFAIRTWTSPPQRVSATRQHTLLQHDFGLLHPRQIIEHQFILRNHTDSPWAIAGIERSCNCTVTRTSSPVVPAHGVVTVHLRYTAPSKNSVERKRVTVFFKEKNVAPVVLQIRAMTRGPLSVEPDEIHLSDISRGRSISSHFDVQNFSSDDWKSISARSEVDWLTCNVTPILSSDQAEKNELPRQLWRIVLHADCPKLPPGIHRTPIHVVAGPDAQFAKSVLLVVNIRRPVVAMPSQFFLGTIRSRDPATSTLILRFANDSVPKDAQAIKFRYTGNGEMSFLCKRISNTNRWRLKATLTKTPAQPYLEGQVKILFSGTRIEPITIPVHGRFQ